MNLRTVPYHHRYYERCVDLMSDTWDFNRLFPNLRRPNLVNRFFFHEAIADANYSEVIVDDHDAVHGFIFATVAPGVLERLRGAITSLSLRIRAWWHWLTGRLGPRAEAWERIMELSEMTGELEAGRLPADGYVNLFFVGSSMRGLGWGKRLMSRVEEACRARGVDRLYLWTDKGCNFGFYDHAGFTRTLEVSSPVLADPGPEANGFVYTKDLTRAPVTH